MKKELLKGLSEEQIKKVKNCKDPKEILALAKEEGVELNDEQLEAVSGGGCITDSNLDYCGWCNSKNYLEVGTERKNGGVYHKFECQQCGYFWYSFVKD